MLDTAAPTCFGCSSLWNKRHCQSCTWVNDCLSRISTESTRQIDPPRVATTTKKSEQLLLSFLSKGGSFSLQSSQPKHVVSTALKFIKGRNSFKGADLKKALKKDFPHWSNATLIERQSVILTLLCDANILKRPVGPISKNSIWKPHYVY